MEVTTFGWILIPIALLAFAKGIVFLLPLVVISSVFQASAVLNFYEPIQYSITPYYFVCLLIAFRLILLIFCNFWMVLLPIPQLFRRSIFFFLWAMVSATVMPFIFEGIGTFNPRTGMDAQYQNLTPLTWNLGNLTQLLYLLLNIMLLFIAWHYGREATLRRRLFNAFNLSGIFVILVALYQKGSFVFGWPFPADFFYSNPAARVPGEDIIGLTRVFSTFSEPSLCSAFLVAFLIFTFNSPSNSTPRVFMKLIIILAGTVTLFWTQATTGFAAIVLVMAGWFGLRLIKPLLQGTSTKKQQLTITIVMVILIAGLIAGVFAVKETDLTHQVFFQKADTLSVVYRTAADWYAIQLFIDTWGGGVGLGSNRPSSFLTFLLSTMGLPGILLFLALIDAQIRMYAQKLQELGKFEGGVLPAAFWTWIGVLLSMSIAIPDIAWQLLWVTWIMLLVSIRSTGSSPSECA